MTADEGRRGPSRHAMNLTVAVLGTVGALGYLWAASTYDFGTLAQPGPSVFPLIAVGPLLLVGSVGLGVATWRGRGEASGEVGWPSVAGWSRMAAITAAVTVYAWGLPFLGHITAASIVVLTVLKVMDLWSWGIRIIAAFAIAFLSYWLFADLLGSPLPRGPFGV